MVTKTKSLLESKTFWVAVIQAVIGIAVVLETNFPELQVVGGIAIAKSILDVILRSLTISQVTSVMPR